MENISKYGVTLKLLTHDKIEMVRQWRNDPKIQQYMEYREEISPEMQEKWYQKISNSGRDYYFIISYKGEDVGLINMKDFNEDMTEAEAGVFIYDDKYLNTDLSYRAHIVMLDYFYQERELEYTISHILKTNHRAQRFALFLGSKLCDGQDDVENQKYIMNKEDYLNNKNRLRFLKREEFLKAKHNSNI